MKIVTSSNDFQGLSPLPDLQFHPKLGAAWEGFALEQVVGLFNSRDAYYWATYSGAELDLLVHFSGRRNGFEFKYSDAPGISRSMHIAMQDLSLDHLWVVYPGRQTYPLDEHISVIPLDVINQLANKDVL